MKRNRQSQEGFKSTKSSWGTVGTIKEGKQQHKPGKRGIECGTADSAATAPESALCPDRPALLLPDSLDQQFNQVNAYEREVKEGKENPTEKTDSSEKEKRRGGILREGEGFGAERPPCTPCRQGWDR